MAQSGLPSRVGVHAGRDKTISLLHPYNARGHEKRHQVQES